MYFFIWVTLSWSWLSPLLLRPDIDWISRVRCSPQHCDCYICYIDRNVDSFSPSGCECSVPPLLTEWVVSGAILTTRRDQGSADTWVWHPVYTETHGASWREQASASRDHQPCVISDPPAVVWFAGEIQTEPSIGFNLQHVLQLWRLFLAPEIFFRVYIAVKLRREGKLQASENLWGSFPIFANDTDTPFRWKVHDLCFENSIWSERSNISREHRVV